MCYLELSWTSRNINKYYTIKLGNARIAINNLFDIIVTRNRYCLLEKCYLFDEQKELPRKFVKWLLPWKKRTNI